MNRLPLGDTLPLRVSPLQGSLLGESMSSAPPPHYMAHGSFAALEQPLEPEVGDDDSLDQSSLSMHSCEDLPDDALPSPHSVEDLSGTDDRQDDEATTIAHGYTFPNTDSSYTTSTPPPTSGDSQLSHSGTSSARNGPSPYSQETRTRYARHYSTPTSPSASYGMLSQTIATSDTSTPRTIYHHRPSSQPAGIGQMTYRHNKNNYEVYHDANQNLFNDDHRTSRSQPPPGMASTATFLPEGQPSQFRSQANLSTVSHTQQPSTDTQNSTSSTVITSSQASPGRATNYVSLSRKSTVKKSGFFRKSVVSSSITGKFTIDPSLHISPALLKAFETPSSLVTELFPGMRPKGVPAKPRVKNLHLEVENGGIDVDIHLVPPPRNAARRLTIGAKPPAPPRSPPRSQSVPPPPVPAVPAHGRMSFDRMHMSEESYVRAGFGPRPSARSRSIDIQPRSWLESSSPPAQAPEPAPAPKTTPSGPTPTLLDLRLKEVRTGKSTKNTTKKGKEFGIVARVHAPNPRPPFHLFASTVDIIPYTPSAQPHTGIPPPDPNSKAKRAIVRPPRRPAPVPYSRSQSRSPLTLHLPRTFRGALTVHVGAGDIDAHVRLSKGMEEAAVVLAESAYSRGYFVGKLAADEGTGGLGLDWVFGERDEEDEEKEADGAVSGEEGREQRAHGEDITAAEAKSAEEEKEEEEEEWTGDKVDLFVGSGKVYLQLLGEENAFGKPGFWSKLRGRH